MEAKKKPDFDNYQKAAINVLQNAVVSAGAGSGKTTVLSERFLHLIQMENGCNVDEILTLTFTKKATVEMSDRIYKVLKEKAPEQASNFFKANIKTLDSYCSSVAKLGCHYYGISPDFTSDDGSIAQQALQKALPFILEHRDNLAIKSIVNTQDYEEYAQELFVKPILSHSFIAEPIDFDVAIEKQVQEVFSVWKSCCKETDDLINQLVGVYNDFAGNRETVFLQSLKTFIEDSELPGIVELSIEDIKNSNSEKIEYYTSAINQIASIRFPGGKASNDVISLKEVLTEIRAKVAVLISLCNFVSGFKITCELIPLLKEFQEIVNNIKRSTGALTFGDISNMALCILRDHPEIRKLEKEKYKFIMIDEFQDNNQMQRDMLFLLAEKPERMDIGIPTVNELCPEKLFFVGDEKQSIYLFRGAEVEVFRGLSNDFSEGNLAMTTNYRSNQALIAAFNTIFGGYSYPPAKITGRQNNSSIPSVFYNETQAKNNDVPEYEAIYHEVTLSSLAQQEAENPENLEKIYAPKVHFALFDKTQEITDKDLSSEEAEAEWISLEIKKLIQNGKAASDIAILMRNYSLQALYERSLLKHGIPYNTEVLKGFFSDGPINDIMALLKICAYPEDTISYAQVLRSPFVNLSIAETVALIHKNGIPFAENGEILCGKSLENYKKMQNFYENLQISSKNEPLYATISKIWYLTGYRYETMWNTTVEMYSKLYDLLFELARKADEQNLGLPAFVDMVEVYKDENTKMEGMDIPLDQIAGVHILTIHKSKGLEYDTVFVTGTHKKGKNDTNSSPIFSSREFGISINTPPCKSFSNNKAQYFYDKTKDLEAAKHGAELRRLVYVALTRAKNELYITNGSYKMSKSASDYLPGGKNPNTIFNVLEPILNYYSEDDVSETAPFDITFIPTYSRFNNEETGENIEKRRNTVSQKKILINELESKNPYEKAEKDGNVITKEVLSSKYINPSKLHSADDETLVNSVYQKNTSQTDLYPEITEYVMESIPAEELKHHQKDPSYEPKPRFDYTDFGTIAHAYMEAAINGVQPQIHEKLWVGLENSTRKIEKIKEICENMSEKFKNSEIGHSAIGSTEFYAEYEFRSKVGKKIIKGVIDLVFKNADGTYTVLDYKTNQEEKPEIYYNQLACYRQTIGQMLGIKDVNSIKCVLFYLRSGNAVDITKACSNVNLEQAVNEL